MTNPHRCYLDARTIGFLALALLAPGCGSDSQDDGNTPRVSESGGVANGGKGGALTSSSPLGGAATGGSVTGGASTSSGGVTGGTATGGSATSVASTGGTRATGGAAAVGGNATGGTAIGGAATGGAATGGAATGGAATGGAATGGAVTGGAHATGGSMAGTGGARTGGAGAGGVSNTSGGAGGGSSSTGGSGGTAAFSPCPASGTCAIMPLGDSITDGVGSSQGGGYRVQLFHDAVQGKKGITFVGSATDPNGPATVDGKTFPRNHEGHPGYTVDNSSTTSGISPLVDASIAANRPNIILLMIGTNDLNRNVDPTNFPTRLGALLDKIINDAPNSLVVVAKITPWQDDGTNANAVEPFNTKIATVVQARITSGKHVALVDMYTPFRANTNYKTALMGDYLHPNDAGYVIMGDVWYAAIKDYLPAAP